MVTRAERRRAKAAMVTVLAADVLIAIVGFSVLAKIGFQTSGVTGGTARLHEQFMDAMFLGGGAALALFIGAVVAFQKGATGVAVFQWVLIALVVAYMFKCVDAFHYAVSMPVRP